MSAACDGRGRDFFPSNSPPKDFETQLRRSAHASLRISALILVTALATGCASSALNKGRAQFYQGDFEGSVVTLQNPKGDKTDRVLVLMERGNANQNATNYAASVDDWQHAEAEAQKQDYLSVSRETASMLANDSVLVYCGAPYERVLMHTYAALSYIGLGLWQDAGVEGRIVIHKLEHRGDYPDDPFSRYVAAMALELMGDRDGARYEYRKAAALAKHCSVNPDTGRLSPPINTNDTALVGPPPRPSKRPSRPETELIVIVSVGHGPADGSSVPGQNSRWGWNPYAEVYVNSNYLGRSYVLATTGELDASTDKVDALRLAAKNASRVVVKESASWAVSQQNEDLGAILRLILFAFESPSERKFETLPQWMGVARVTCPRHVSHVEIVIKNGGGQEVDRQTVSTPLLKQGNLYVTFVRGL